MPFGLIEVPILDGNDGTIYLPELLNPMGVH